MMPSDEPTVVLLTRRCATCIYRKDENGQIGGLMNLDPGRTEDMTNETIRLDTNVVCHKSLGVGGEWAENAYCFGNVATKGPGQMLRIMERLGLIRLVHPNDMEPCPPDAPGKHRLSERYYEEEGDEWEDE